METVDDIFQSKYLSAADLKGKPHVLVIATARSIIMGEGDKQQSKILITFQGAKKSFLANRTNSKRIAYIHGPVLDTWIGKKIELYPDLVDFKGEPTEAIRVRKAPERDTEVLTGNGGEMRVQDRGTHKITTMAPAKMDDGLDDEVGF